MTMSTSVTYSITPGLPGTHGVAQVHGYELEDTLPVVLLTIEIVRAARPGTITGGSVQLSWVGLVTTAGNACMLGPL